jgi:hypothetical protein
VVLSSELLASPKIPSKKVKGIRPTLSAGARMPNKLSNINATEINNALLMATVRGERLRILKFPLPQCPPLSAKFFFFPLA